MPDRYLNLIEEMLESAVSQETIPEGLRASMRYSLLSGGKRLRPCFCLACCEMLGGDIGRALPLACGIEMIHTYSLVHDDLPCMDNDDVRRGKPSNHKVFGEAGAMLAGDALLTHAFEWMLARAPKNDADLRGYMRAVLTIARGAGASGMVAGQSLELSGALERGSVALDEVHRLKTGALIRAAALSGGLAAGADDAALRALEAFAEHFGALFQITDDILDAEKEMDDGKNYVTLFGMEQACTVAYFHARKARDAILPYGENAAYLLMMVENTLSRAD
jgi:geranylgeranyl diphosphate synthase type II